MSQGHVQQIGLPSLPEDTNDDIGVKFSTVENQQKSNDTKKCPVFSIIVSFI